MGGRLVVMVNDLILRNDWEHNTKAHLFHCIVYILAKSGKKATFDSWKGGVIDGIEGGCL
jgi:hypothetical protein